MKDIRELTLQQITERAELWKTWAQVRGKRDLRLHDFLFFYENDAGVGWGGVILLEAPRQHPLAVSITRLTSVQHTAIMERTRQDPPAWVICLPFDDTQEAVALLAGVHSFLL